MARRNLRPHAAGFVLAACAATGLFGCGGLGWRRRPKPPVFLVSVDTLRADRLPAYGFRGVETPAIDALRRDGVLFTHAFGHVPLTLPSHLTMFTGRLPFENGVRDNAGYELRADVPTLAEELKADGYATGAAVSAVVLSKATGVARGFDFYEDGLEAAESHEALGEVQRPGLATEELLERWIEGAGEKPLFAFLHLYEPHTPYDPPEPFRGRYPGDPYLGEIAAADDVVGRFVSFLKARGLYDRALVLFVSDHGEGLGEHGEAEHGIFLYRSTLHVPFLAKLPGGAGAGTTDAREVGLADVFPTILTAVRGRAPERPFAVDALAAGRDAPIRRLYAETLYPRLHLGWSDLASLTDGRWHYVEAPRPELYDMDADPAEKADLAPGVPDAFRSLRTALANLDRSFRPPTAADADRRAQLAALGYLSATRAGTGPLPDPKDRIAGYEDARQAMGLSAAGRDAEAVPRLEAILARDPAFFDVWFAEALSLSRLGRVDDAIAAAQKGLRSAPSDSPELVHLLAELYLRKGNTPEALRHARLARAMGEPKADFLLPEIYLAAGDLARAEEAARSAVLRASSPARPRLVLAKVLQAKGDVAGALSETDAALRAARSSRAREPRFFHLYRGELLMSVGRIPEAIGELETEMRGFPPSDDVALSLVRAYALGGRRNEARALAGRVVDLGPRRPEILQRAMIALEAGRDAEGGAALRRRGQREFPGDVRFQLPRPG